MVGIAADTDACKICLCTSNDVYNTIFLLLLKCIVSYCCSTIGTIKKLNQCLVISKIMCWKRNEIIVHKGQHVWILWIRCQCLTVI